MRLIHRIGLGLAVCLTAMAPNPMASKILVIRGNTLNTVPTGAFSIGDTFVKTRLESLVGSNVEVIKDSVPEIEMRSAADAAHLVVILESTDSRTLKTKLKATPTPVLIFEAFSQDDMGLSIPGTGGDPGPPALHSYGVMDQLNAIDILATDHPLAAGLSGRVIIYSARKQVSWSKVAPTAQVVATLPGDTSGAATIYVYEKGVKLSDGTVAAGMRIGFFLEDDDKSGTPNLMTPEGLKLFDAAVAYALNGGAPTAVLRMEKSKRVEMAPGVDALGRANQLREFQPSKMLGRFRPSKS